MNRFFFIVWHYLKRATRDFKEIALLIAIPLGVTIFTTLMVGEMTSDMEWPGLNGYNVFASHMAPAFVLSFQFFNSFFMFIFLYSDFRGAMRWRLLAAPCPVRSFVFPAFIANWILSLALGVVLIVLATLILNIYWGSLFVLAVVLALISLMATFIAVLIFLFTHKLAQANAVGYVVSFGLMILSGFMVPLQVFGDNFLTRFLTTYGTPLSLGSSAIVSSGELSGFFDDFNVILPGVSVGDGVRNPLINIGILAAITTVLGLSTVIAARRRKI